MQITDFIHSAAQVVQGGQAAIGGVFGVDVGQLNADLAVLNALMPQQPQAQQPQSQQPQAERPATRDNNRINFRGIWDKYWIILSIIFILIVLGFGWMIFSWLFSGDQDNV